jgi:hypothetical protein
MTIKPLVVLALVGMLGGCAGGASNQDKPLTSASPSGPTAGATAGGLGASPGATVNAIPVEMATATKPDGSAASPTTEFHRQTDRKIIAVVTVQDLPAGTKLSYVRYLDGKFVDSKSAVVGAGARHFYFTFAAVTGQSFAAGTYRLRLYVNERTSGEVVYRVI